MRRPKVALKGKKGKKSLDFVANKLRFFSANTAKLCNRIGISPNIITLGRFFTFGCGSAAFFLVGGYFYNFLGLVSLLVNYFLDLVDGDLARNFNKKTHMGEFLDSTIDSIVINLVILAITFNLFLTDNPLKYFSLLALFGQTLSNRASYNYKSKFGTSSIAILNKRLSRIGWGNKSDTISIFLIELLTPSHIFSSFFSTIRYYLLTGVILGILPFTIGIYSIVINARWIILFTALSFYYKNDNFDKKITIFNTFREIEGSKQ